MEVSWIWRGKGEVGKREERGVVGDVAEVNLRVLRLLFL